MNIQRILLSLAVLVFAGAVVVGGTGAFFSDEETSTGNVFAAGSLDLKVDSEAHYNNMICENVGSTEEPVYQWQPEPDFDYTEGHYPVQGEPCDGTWEETDLGPTNHFFNFSDLKPGDTGENTLSLHVYDNDAYACAILNTVTDREVGDCTEPEEEAGDTTCLDNEQGELGQELHFFAWADDGDNIWEVGEPTLFSNVQGPASDVIGGVTYPMYTPQTGPLSGGTTVYTGLYWCYGDITVDETNHTLACNGSTVSNVSQSDKLEASITFYVEQARNNDEFTCPTDFVPAP